MSTALLSPETVAAALGQFPPTPEQSAVISAPLAPALVVAGAGSGKTETMAGRVVWLVANGLVRRDEVLGLTFTRKAAGELAERIGSRLRRLAEFERRGLLPHLERLNDEGRLAVFGELERAGAPESARRAALDALAPEPTTPEAGDAMLERPAVSTYNSFADAIVRENAVRIGRDAEAVVLSESAAWLLMRQVVLSSDDTRLPDRIERPSTIIDAALRIARDSVDNLADLDDLDAFAEEFQGVLERPSQRAATTVYADVRTAAEKVSGLAVLTSLARTYEAEKRRRGLIDFSDQVAGALQVVRAHPSVAEELRQRYRVVLLDEYQDTSVVQTDLLATLFRDTAVMAVGDPHQSIYGWRGASAGNLGDFARSFDPDAGARTYSLLTSWRNGVDVLRAAGAVLAPLEAPVEVGTLRPREGAPTGRVDIVVETDVDAEADAVAEWFRAVRDERHRGGRSTTAAVLVRSKKHMLRFADALGRRGIPHRILGLGGLLSTPEVVDVVSALRVISDPRAGSALIRLLSGPRWAIGLADLRELAQVAARLVRHDTALQPLPPELAETIRSSAGDEGGSLVAALDFVARQKPDHGWLAGFTPAARERLRDAGAVFAGLRRAAGLPIPELVRLIENELRLDIELAANESRGPARTASDQLRAFIDELHGFLQTDERGSLPSLLAWLDRAERIDEFAPRTEPPEDDVVQLLTIHGSKGLEWDAVAVVRGVEEELPARLQDSKGWLGFGVLPYSFRGDREWLPDLRWRAPDAPSQQDLKTAFGSFTDGIRERHLAEERRLAYVAVTRAREHLLISASPWAGTKKPREVSRFVREIAEELGIALPDADVAENPYEGARATLDWPIDPLGSRAPRVREAAARVEAAMNAPAATPTRDLDLLLAERAARAAGRERVAPTRIPASRFKDFVADYDAAATAVARPLPERPYRQTRLGTLFHAWVEQRSGLVGRSRSVDDVLWDDDESVSMSPADADALDRLRDAFLASEWGPLQPIEVETEIDFVDPDALGDGRPHIVICKLDAVYRRGDRIEIVDWKTGRPPRTPAERTERMLQLELYRRAYHAKHGVPMDRIDVVLFYVADGLILRG
ncbi:ATP-dependent DNA helicase [Microbacterium sp. 77mftsu3.1]|uniref:ATP-dependent DNA helicase n=1 Tax=Microbacterium sp. 77mftsu3.1 TaxID=1761802 RepID=UPI00037CBED6|nr:ATP-dependent DNA helicase [Microbacterium sp. 77mftsu3.1]SDG24584.1 DNA helicase-2 / ATP-dependent DNA helicase PcrA [Microbacterium sp. 77mftsu3.1]